MTAKLLQTDGYKFSMAEAGWPLRPESFIYTHRKGGVQVLPFDVEAELRALLPKAEFGDWGYLASNDYEMGSAYKAGIAAHAGVKVQALPRFSVFGEREPVFTVTGPSALVSWLEPLLLTWSYRIQVATVALFRPDELADAVRTVTCAAQKDLVLKTLDAVQVQAPVITVDEAGYVARVRAQAKEIVALVGSPGRVFEVGLRAASCVEQHLLALEALKAEGVTRTSHVWGAKQLGMVPVGTMGHEHVQRYGSDEAAFRAMVERRHQRSSFLLDTFDTITSGLPTAYAIIKERSGQGDSIRYDSGDKVVQYREATRLARELGIRPVHILEDGFDAAQTQRFEELRREEGVAENEQVYGFGGYFIARTAGTPLTRDRVAAVYKLSQTGKRPTMKFANEAGSGKQSVPGKPVVFRRGAGASGPFGLIGQEGEAAPAGYTLLTGAPSPAVPPTKPEVAEADLKPGLTPETQKLVDALTAEAFGRTPS